MGHCPIQFEKCDATSGRFKLELYATYEVYTRHYSVYAGRPEFMCV